MKRKTALYGLLTALALVCSYVEVLLPLPLGIPGVRLGLANGVVLVALMKMGTADAFAVNGLRILVAGLTFGHPVSMLYSLCGGLFSLCVMMLCRRSGRFSVLGVGMAGGVCHNIGQLLVAGVLMGTARLWWYAVVLLPVGLLTGAGIGLVVRLLLPRLKGLD